MKISKYNLIWLILLSSAVVFGQKQTKKINNSFSVNKDVLIEINTRHTDVTVETWNKNMVSIKGVWEIEGMTKEKATKYVKAWNFEALGNKNKVVITSKSSANHLNPHSNIFDDIDFDLESITHTGQMFNGNYYSELPPMPPMSPLSIMSPMPPMEPLPPFPVPIVDPLTELKFDYKAYKKDKESYMKDFEKRQKVWKKEFEEKFKPQMEAYKKKMEEWQKQMAPQMKVYEKKMKLWEKQMAPQMRVYERKMEVQAKRIEKKMKQIEKEMEVKYAKKIKEKRSLFSENYNIKKSFLIKVPSSATLKVDIRYGKIILPKNIKIIK